jgi:hypothetical protein
MSLAEGLSRRSDESPKTSRPPSAGTAEAAAGRPARGLPHPTTRALLRGITCVNPLEKVALHVAILLAGADRYDDVGALLY